MLSLYETNETPDDFTRLLNLDVYYQVCAANKDSHINPNIVVDFNEVLFLPDAERRNRILSIVSKQDESSKRQLDQEDEIQYI
ncbi:hypothetical protein LMH73_004490 [Vibrio splendidus]|nr:hypothetical protein [Vibrio splendidus]MCC4883263.1 hypothetical protein [Vibrio splendidus]